MAVKKHSLNTTPKVTKKAILLLAIVRSVVDFWLEVKADDKR